MGFFDFQGRLQEGRRRRRQDKVEPGRQAGGRGQQACAGLRSPGGVNELAGLAPRTPSRRSRRFTFSTDPSITDQGEELAFEASSRPVAGRSSPCAFVARRRRASPWPMRVMKEILEPDEYVEELSSGSSAGTPVREVHRSEAADPRGLGELTHPKIREATDSFLGRERPGEVQRGRGRARAERRRQHPGASQPPPRESVCIRTKIANGMGEPQLVRAGRPARIDPQRSSRPSSASTAAASSRSVSASATVRSFAGRATTATATSCANANVSNVLPQRLRRARERTKGYRGTQVAASRACTRLAAPPVGSRATLPLRRPALAACGGTTSEPGGGGWKPHRRRLRNAAVHAPSACYPHHLRVEAGDPRRLCRLWPSRREGRHWRTSGRWESRAPYADPSDCERRLGALKPEPYVYTRRRGGAITTPGESRRSLRRSRHPRRGGLGRAGGLLTMLDMRLRQPKSRVSDPDGYVVERMHASADGRGPPPPRHGLADGSLTTSNVAK